MSLHCTALARQTQNGMACGGKIAVPQMHGTFMDRGRSKWRLSSAVPVWTNGVVAARRGGWGNNPSEGHQAVAGSTATEGNKDSQVFVGGIGFPSGADHDLCNSAIRQIAEQGDRQFGCSFNGSGIGGTSGRTQGVVRGLDLGIEPRDKKTIRCDRRNG